MRRLLLIFLLVFMPLQSIWAAASSYCGHEAEPQASHFGHHVHEHHGDQGADHSAPAAGPSTVADMDCHTCHGTGSGLAHSASAEAVAVAVAHLPGQATPAWPPVPLVRPERPNWPAFA